MSLVVAEPRGAFDAQDAKTWRGYQYIRTRDEGLEAGELCREIEAATGRRLHFDADGPDPDGILTTAILADTGWAIVSVRLHPDAPALTKVEQDSLTASIESHKPTRAKADSEYVAEFGDPRTSAERRDVIRDIMGGLLPRERVLA